MLEKFVTVALWFAFALATVFAVQAYGWLGLIGVVALLEVGHLFLRWKDRRWPFSYRASR